MSSRPCRSGHTDCTVDCGWCKGTGYEDAELSKARLRHPTARALSDEDRAALQEESALLGRVMRNPNAIEEDLERGHLRTTCYRCSAPGVPPYNPEVDSELCPACLAHADRTFVRAVEPRVFQAQCDLCGWQGQRRESYSDAVEDSQLHAYALCPAVPPPDEDEAEARLMEEWLANRPPTQVERLQRLLRLANAQLASSFAPITEFKEVADDPALLAEAQEALRHED